MVDKLAGEGLGAENTGNLIQMWRYFCSNPSLPIAGYFSDPVSGYDGDQERNKYAAGYLLSTVSPMNCSTVPWTLKIEIDRQDQD